MRHDPLGGRSVLVTGANGFVGRAVARRLIESDAARLLFLSRRGAPLENARVTQIHADLASLTPAHFVGMAPEIVIHLAAFTPKDQCQANDMARVQHANIDGLRCLLEALPDSVRRFVFISTLDVYEPDVAHCISEATPTNPQTLYAASKLFGETLTRIVAREREWEHAILRLGHIYGEGEQAYAKLIPATIERLLGGLPPRVHGTGTELRDFLHVDDASEAILRAASHPQPELGPLNIVSGRSVSVRKLLALLAELCEWSGGIEHVDTPCSGRSYCFNNIEMKKALGDWPKVELRDGLAREIAAFREQRHAA